MIVSNTTTRDVSLIVLTLPGKRLIVIWLSLALSLGLLGFLPCISQAQTQTLEPKEVSSILFPVRVGGKWGYIDKTGRFVWGPSE